MLMLFSKKLKPKLDIFETHISPNMAKSVEVDSVWYIVSMNWINKWQCYTGFNDDSQPAPECKPGEIDNSDIIHEFYRDGKNNISSCQLMEISDKYAW